MAPRTKRIRNNNNNNNNNNKSNSKSRKKVYQKRSASSTVGKILPPLDVKTPEDIPGFLTRLGMGPITIVMVYADWCGHCHTMRPKFDAASNSPDRTCQVASINETQVENVNNALKTSVNKSANLNPSGYPSGFIMQRNGESAPLELVPDALPEVMNKSGTLAEEAGLSTSTSLPSTSLPSTSLPANENVLAIRSTSSPMNPSPMNPSTIVVPTSEIVTPTSGLNSYVKEDKQRGSTASTALPLVSPPTDDRDMSLRPLNKPVGTIGGHHGGGRSNGRHGGGRSNGRHGGGRSDGRHGGSLYQAMSQAAYTLAPTAALIAAASIVTRQERSKHSMKRKQGKQGKQRKQRTQRTQRKQRKQ